MIYDIKEEDKEILKQYKELLKNSYETLSKDDIEIIRKAFEVTVDAHKNQKRKSGEPYIFHPIAVAKIVSSQIGLGAESIAVALMHDVVEDSKYTVKDIEQLFGKEIAKNVEGLTKISILSKNKANSIQAENLKKVILTLNEDPSVILIKIADRLHNMRTLEFMTAEKQKRIASETHYIYAPLSHRLGLYEIKNELEDLGLKYIDAKGYETIKKSISDDKYNTNLLSYFSKKISKILSEHNITADVKWRNKSIFSIYQKMRKKNIPFGEVFDRFAIRIIYNTENEQQEKEIAFNIYAAIAKLYQPNPTRIRDWINQPKSTGYEALHFTVMGPSGKWVEIQTRSQRMDEIAERGHAAHVRYKQQESNYKGGLAHWLEDIKEMLSRQTEDPVEFLNDFKLSLYTEDIFAFTPRGELKALPRGASALDFGFAVHTDIGLNCRMTKINNKIKPINTVLKSGDQVEIITSNSQKIERNWLNFVITAKAKSAIRNAIRNKEKKNHKEGEETLRRKLEFVKVKLNDRIIKNMMHYFDLQSPKDLFYKVSQKEIDNQSIREFFNQQQINNRLGNFFKKKPKKNTALKDKKQAGIIFDNNKKYPYELANCCTPLKGDEIFGYKNKLSKKIIIHSQNCNNAISIRARQYEEIINARWIEENENITKIDLQIKGTDRNGIVSEILLILLQEKTKVMNISINNDEGIFEGLIGVEIFSRNHLERVQKRIKEIMGIIYVKTND